jgi:hypothetical protein
MLQQNGENKMTRILYTAVVKDNGKIMSIGGFPPNFPDPAPHEGTLEAADGQALDISPIPTGDFIYFLSDKWKDAKFKNAVYLGTSGEYLGDMIAAWLQSNSANAETFVGLHPPSPDVGD